jgi:hypothetical protein
MIEDNIAPRNNESSEKAQDDDKSVTLEVQDGQLGNNSDISQGDS